MKPQKATQIKFTEYGYEYTKIVTSIAYKNMYLAQAKKKNNKLISVIDIPISEVELFVLKHNENIMLIGTEEECYFYLHDNTAASWELNLKNGYSITKLEEEKNEKGN